MEIAYVEMAKVKVIGFGETAFHIINESNNAFFDTI